MDHEVPADSLMMSLRQDELFKVRALCDEIMNSLCQAKALLEPTINNDDFFHCMKVEILRNYFCALDTIIDGALEAKDNICQMIDNWQKQL